MTRTQGQGTQTPSLCWRPILRISELSLACLPSTPTWARRHVADVLGRWDLPEVVRENAELLTSELMTNAIQVAQAADRGHTASVPVVRLRVRLVQASLFIKVWDPIDAAPVTSDADLLAESGRGLVIVNALASAWGFYPTEDGGKVFWAELRMP